MIELQKLIENIKKEPEKFLGSLSIELLRAFIAGYAFAQLDLGVSSTETISIPINFHGWLCQKLKVRNNNLSWGKIINLFSKNDTEAFNLFENLFSEFCQTHKELFEREQRQENVNKMSKPSLDSIIMRIKPYPAIYLEVYSLSRFVAFLNGYLKACEDLSSSSEEIRREINNFAIWLAKEIEKEIKIYPKCSWHKTLLLFYPDEKVALEQFFNYYSKYSLEQS